VKTDVSVPVNNQDLWAVGQNIPNPVQALTSIPFSIPEDGTVRFTMMSVSGQVLYTEDIQAKSGSHIYDYNTMYLANGIYYYSMEYVGQKIVKKMTVQK
ncbi:MAG: T9SS type A sorting domain-containing protein, partial [Bacteroidales bacterium]|nr:T9SS type A sorting domain-containing protein [Bacteroidales bacterium]